MTALGTITGNYEEAKAHLREWGFCLIENPLPPAKFKELVERLTELAEAEREDNSAFLYDGGNQRVFGLLNKGTIFEEIVQNEAVCELMEELLGYNFLLSSIHANIAGPGGARMALHPDQTFARMPWPPYPFVANSMWMLDDFTEENGATRVIPGTHLLGRPPDYAAGEGDIETQAVCGPAGTVMVFDGRLWHQTGANRTKDRLRHGILVYYCRAYIRQQENPFVAVDRDVHDRATPLMRRLLGWEIYQGALGQTGGLPT
ncbi:hypothetical protein Ssi03_22120 [Sphaerisporangium siamense]|uniref:Ectoine hydroxylase-related dioxygenase (Phytanoyl-CoA dioxygenase family) n=1 Tax=Sphaerisporangium siamense TaxID=795645 RepID=A0A7W7D9H1_9ACTN|nr:phytanoyl-CoA dioxygenase family protein [Sphaerisporangium siamense]MBB4701870.1 ectoine hydroxylase-related dioxygenase (phytanoyl-CoA dioxygenase family) [Sphaerisporangium siamense]GII84222.1 hypothetical protein Ssi03_22120 [Sphaerisporangium siamense]